ncbi:signal transduction histidine kinase [Cutibacterium acnes JCM 18918]|nr:signal transduction histidine kinase [Cutibacterium acnes JCM 18918]
MPALNRIVADRTRLDDADITWLEDLVDDWQMLADTSFSDSSCGFPIDPNVFWAVARCVQILARLLWKTTSSVSLSLMTTRVWSPRPL